MEIKISLSHIRCIIITFIIFLLTKTVCYQMRFCCFVFWGVEGKGKQNKYKIIYITLVFFSFFSYHQSAKKPVLFFEVTNSILKKYLDCRSRDNKQTKEVKTVVSTENEVYLFPKYTNSNLCKNIAWCLTHYRENL